MILRISSYSVRMRENADQKTPTMDFSRSENYIIFQKKKKKIKWMTLL